MKNILIIMITIIVGGCSYDDNGKMIPMTLQVMVYDDCEYLYRANMLAHKGNCKFCERRRLNQDSIATKTYAEIIKIHKEAQR